MPSSVLTEATNAAMAKGSALLKFISANDVGETGSHQYGFYLPKDVWQLYSPHPPTDGELQKHWVGVRWQGEFETDSCVTWYGRRTRSEYRFTRFGRGFPFLTGYHIGSLLVLVPEKIDRFLCFVLDTESDIEDIQANLGLKVVGTWAVYGELDRKVADEQACVDQRLTQFAAKLSAFPGGEEMSEETRDALACCIPDFASLSPDDRLLRYVESEYCLFKLVERQITLPFVKGGFKSIDDFITLANSVLNRRKARAGRSFENHVEYLLKETRIPLDVRPNVDGKPDFIFPGKKEYDDPEFPSDRLVMLGLKTTCKDRWRQVLNEASRIPRKHLLTLQPAISCAQIEEMMAANVTLIVPKPLHGLYPKVCRKKLLTMSDFMSEVVKLYRSQ